jgi:hypothetical protein
MTLRARLSLYLTQPTHQQAEEQDVTANPIMTLAQIVTARLR